MASDTDRIVAAMESLAASNSSLKQVANSFDNFDVMRLVDALEQVTNVSQQNTAQLERLVAQEMQDLDGELKREKQADERESQRQKNHDEWLQQTAKQMKLNRDLKNQFGLLGIGIGKLFNGFNRFAVGIGKFYKTFDKFTRTGAGFFGGLFSKGKGLFKGFGGLGKFAKGAAAIGKAALGGVKGFYDKLKLGLNLFLASNPISLAVKKIGGFIFNKTVGKMLGATAKIFKMGIQYGIQFAKVMVALPLQIVGSVAKIGHQFRRDIVETVGTAVENVKEFVDVNDGLGKSIKDMSTSSEMSLNKFLDPTSDLVKMFGDGPNGLASAIQQSGQALKDMGILADVAGGSIAKNITHYTQAIRSLGMSGEDVSYITAEAVKNGESIYTVLDRFVVANNNVSKQFGVDRKKLSLNFLKLRKDITNFGHLTDKELMQTSARLTQLGVDMQAATAVFSKMDTFESAAQSAAMLSQTFGMNLDALKLLRAEKPEEILEQFRDAMLATGRSFDDLNRHEKSLMESHTGLNAQQLKMTMNYRTLGMSYSDIQRKMKEDDPTQQQIKNLKLMSGSLKEIQKTLAGENVFKNFTDGVLETMKAASGLSPILLRVSKRFQDFFVAGLKVSEKTKSTLTNVFKPFTDVLKDMVGDGKNNKGLLDADKFKSTFESFATKFGGLLGKAFKKNSNLQDIQRTFRSELKNTFDFSKINQGNTIVGQLFKTSGKLIGQFLKGFAALGPGLIDVTFDALDSLIDFLTNYKDSPKASGLFYNNSIKGMLTNLLGLNSDDQVAIINTFSHLIERVVGTGGPLMRLYSWINVKFAELVKGAMKTVATAAEEGFKNTWAGAMYFGFFDPLTGNQDRFDEGAQKAKQSSLGTFSAQSIQDLYSRKNYEAFESDQIGQVYSMLLNEQKKVRFDTKKSAAVAAMIKKIENTTGTFGMGLDEDEFVKSLAKNLASYQGITLDLKKVNDDVSDITGSNGIGIIKRTGKNKAIVKQTTIGDQTITGKEGGPVVSAIAYAGNAANAALEGIQGVVSALTGASVSGGVGGGPSEIRIFMQVDGNTLTEVCLDNDIIRKASERKNGRAYLADGTIIDASGNSIQGSSLT